MCVLDTLSSRSYFGMQRLFTFLVVILIAKTNGDPGDFRPPAVPLIVFSPHISGESNFCFLYHKKGRGVAEQLIFTTKLFHRLKTVFLIIEI